VADKSSEMSALRAQHEQDREGAAEEAEQMRAAMAEKHAAATERLMAEHGAALRAAEERSVTSLFSFLNRSATRWRGIIVTVSALSFARPPSLYDDSAMSRSRYVYDLLEINAVVYGLSTRFPASRTSAPSPAVNADAYRTIAALLNTLPPADSLWERGLLQLLPLLI
jgi:hypothetical protein